MIWHRLQIPGSTSLADLHHMIQIVFAWDDDHLHRFHIYALQKALSTIFIITFLILPSLYCTGFVRTSMLH